MLASVGSLARFGVLALIPVIALGAVLAHVLNADVQQRYLDSAAASATLITELGVQPLLDRQELAAGLTSDQVATIDGRLKGTAVSNEIRRIKVWNAAGTIVYSDNHALIGRTFAIDRDLRGALDGHASASVTNGNDEENSGDSLQGPLVQAYIPLLFQGSSTPSGAFEVYLPYAPVQAAIDRESNQLYLFLAAGLLLFYASMFPVAVLADRWRRRLIRQADTTAMANLAVLERLNRMKIEFLTRIGHQFRTALVGIQGFSEVIKDADQLELAEVKSYAAEIFSEATRLDQSFNELLELDRMETGKATLKMARVYVDDLVLDVAERIRTDRPGHVITTDLGGAGTTVRCDPEKVTQALKNLVENAVRYSPAGSEVTITTEVGDEDVTVSVADHGPGMPPDFGEGLLTGYEHARANGAAHAASVGLGLPIARQIVEMHGGRVWFESSRGHGTTFHFTLPRNLTPSRQDLVAVRTLQS